MRHSLIKSIFAAAALFASATPSFATPVTVNATVTADNHYALFYGIGNNLNFVGRNELGGDGNPGTYNWSLPEQFSFTADTGEYLYIIAWSDDSVAQGLIGQFQLSNGTN